MHKRAHTQNVKIQKVRLNVLNLITIHYLFRYCSQSIRAEGRFSQLHSIKMGKCKSLVVEAHFAIIITTIIVAENLFYFVLKL